jgi:hypothetical protein
MSADSRCRGKTGPRPLRTRYKDVRERGLVGLSQQIAASTRRSADSAEERQFALNNWQSAIGNRQLAVCLARANDGKIAFFGADK